MSKNITANTLLKQGEKTYKPVEVNSIIYWLGGEAKTDEPAFDTQEKSTKWSPVLKMLGNTNIVTESFGTNRFIKIIAQSEPKLDGVPVVSLDRYIEKFAEKEYREHPSNCKSNPSFHFNRDVNCFRKRKAFIKGYTSNPNKYNLADIERAIKLTREAFLLTGNLQYNSKILKQINQIQQITVDEQFNILSYE